VNVSSSNEYFERHFTSWINAVTSSLRTWMKAQDIDLLCHSVTILATHGWERQDTTEFGHAALDAITTKFENPLAKVLGFEADKVIEEWWNMQSNTLILLKTTKLCGGNFLIHLLLAGGRIYWQQ